MAAPKGDGQICRHGGAWLCGSLAEASPEAWGSQPCEALMPHPGLHSRGPGNSPLAWAPGTLGVPPSYVQVRGRSRSPTLPCLNL